MVKDLMKMNVSTVAKKVRHFFFFFFLQQQQRPYSNYIIIGHWARDCQEAETNGGNNVPRGGMGGGYRGGRGGGMRGGYGRDRSPRRDDRRGGNDRGGNDRGGNDRSGNDRGGNDRGDRR
jgi:hypothetical protein